MMRRAFTLIEVIMTIIIVGILAVTAYISLAPVSIIRLDAAAKKMAGDIDYARNLSLSTSTWHGVIIKVAPANSYSVYSYSGLTQLPIDDPAVPGRSLAVDFDEEYAGVQVAAVNFDGGNQVDFHPLGTPYLSKSSSVELSADGTITLTYNTKVKTIEVTRGTGKVTVY